jgi:hypothetical protein
MLPTTLHTARLNPPVAELRAVVHLDGQTRQLLDHELRDEPRVPRRAAREDHHAVHLAEPRLGEGHLAEEHLAGLDRRPAQGRLAHGPGLLEDLLEHEVLVARLLGLDRVPRDALRGLFPRAAVGAGERRALARHHGHLAVVQEDHVARVGEQGGHVGRDEELVVAEADDERRPVAHRDDLPRIVGGDEDEREEAAQRFERAAHGALEPVAAHLALDEVRHDLGVRLGDEPVSLGGQLALQIEVVLDDAVVDDDDAARAVAVGVGVLLGRPAVRRPARVADAVLAVERVGGEDLLEPRELARRPPQLHRARADDGQPGRVVAAVLQTAQAVDEQWHDGLGPDVADDPAHLCL